MHTRKFVLLSVLVTLFVSSYALSVYAIDPDGSLKSGYAVTSNYHGVPVPPGAEVTVTAMTTDPKVDTVTFVWKNPADQIMRTVTKSVHSNGTRFNGKLVYYASDTFTPEAIGDWGVQAIFKDVHRFIIWQCTKIVARRSTSFNVIPEIPVIGTVGASVAMVAGFAWKMKKKPEK